VLDTRQVKLANYNSSNLRAFPVAARMMQVTVCPDLNVMLCENKIKNKKSIITIDRKD